jgi:hypothetical protein
MYRSPIYSPPERGKCLSNEFMQFIVEFTGLPFVKLSVDKIIVTDEFGRDLFTNNNIRNRIKNVVSEFSDENHILGWFGYNEPASIDNYLPFREVDSLIKSVNPKLNVFTAFSGYSKSRYTWMKFHLGVNSPAIHPALP